jgi:hypothetical protein
MISRSPSPMYVCLMAAAFICILRQMNNSFFPEVMEPFTEQSKSSTKPNRIQKPKFLAEGKRNDTKLLVHVGKAGGSSIRTQIERLQDLCRTKPQSLHHCSLGRVTRVTHIGQNQYVYPQYSQFLIPIRNGAAWIQVHACTSISIRLAERHNNIINLFPSLELTVL